MGGDPGGAKAEAEKLLADARNNAETMVSEAKTKAEATLSDARNRSEALLADAQESLRAQRALADELASGVLLTWQDGDGHTAYNNGSTCIDTTVDDFLVDGVVPPDGKVCR